MKLSATIFGSLCAIALQTFFPVTAIAANHRSACQILPASQAQRIFGTPVKAGETRAPSKNGNSGSLCTYTGTQTSAMMMVIFATTANVAKDVEKGQRQIGSSADRQVGRKGNIVVVIMGTSSASMARALLAAAMRNI